MCGLRCLWDVTFNTRFLIFWEEIPPSGRVDDWGVEMTLEAEFCFWASQSSVYFFNKGQSVKCKKYHEETCMSSCFWPLKIDRQGNDFKNKLNFELNNGMKMRFWSNPQCRCGPPDSESWRWCFHPQNQRGNTNNTKLWEHIILNFGGELVVKRLLDFLAIAVPT